MDRGTVLVTGGNSGIGFECARRLAANGWQVLIASRNRAASADAVERITRESGHNAVSAMRLDLGSLESVREVAREIQARAVPLRALVCNAGLQVSGGPQRSADGYEITFAAGINPAPKAGSALAELALAPALADVSGKYFPSHTRWREAPSSDASYDVGRARLLWEESVRMTGLTAEESPLLAATESTTRG